MSSTRTFTASATATTTAATTPPPRAYRLDRAQVRPQEMRCLVHALGRQNTPAHAEDFLKMLQVRTIHSHASVVAVAVGSGAGSGNGSKW